MASSSSSLIIQLKYDVFLSFRGEDVRDNFISHLDKALRRKKIKTFIDSELDAGENIFLSILNAIQESKISVIVFSEKYARSRWLVDEFIKIIECKNLRGQIVIPVYYHIDPSNVRKQTGAFGDNFSRMEERFKDISEKLVRFRSALKEATSIPGFASYCIRSDSELVEKIVEEIMKRLQDMSPKNDLASRFLSVFFLVLEAILVVLDLYGKSKKNFLLAAFLLSAFGLVITIHAFIKKRTTAAFKQTAERVLAWVEVIFSVLQLVIVFIQCILAVARVKNSFGPSLFPLVFALLLLVFAFKKKKTVNNHDLIRHNREGNSSRV